LCIRNSHGRNRNIMPARPENKRNILETTLKKLACQNKYADIQIVWRSIDCEVGSMIIKINTVPTENIPNIKS